MSENRVTIVDEPSQPQNRPNALPLVIGAIVVTVGLLALFGLFDEQPSQSSSPLIEPSAPTTTSTTLSVAELAALEQEADVELISDLWVDQTAAWVDGFDAGLTFWVQNNYPDMGCSRDDYMQTWFPDGPVDGLQIERIPNPNTIRADDGWIIPGGRLQGVPAEGRVYVLEVQDTFIAPGTNPQAVIRNFHVSIIDGQAHFFIGCQA